MAVDPWLVIVLVGSFIGIWVIAFAKPSLQGVEFHFGSSYLHDQGHRCTILQPKNERLY